MPFPKQSYLEIGDRAYSIQNRKERAVYRFFECVPALLSFGTLIFAVLFSWLRPVWVGIFIILFSTYWVLKIVYLSIYQAFSFREMRKNLKIDWYKRLVKMKGWEEIYHLVILPVAFEGWEVVKETLKSLKDSSYPKDKIIVVLAQEEAAGKQKDYIAQMARDYCHKVFYNFFVVAHPQNLPGEIAGKGSNVAYSSKFVKNFVDKEKIPYENIIVSVFDADSKVFLHYFSYLTHKYLALGKPKNVSFQPIPVYHNNIWQAPSFARVVAVSNTFWQMMQQERPEQLVTYSSHSMPFFAFIEVGFPKNVVADDSRIFWKAFLKFNGDWKVVPLYYPISMDVVDSPNVFKAILNQYKQQRRWAWGCTEIPFMLYGFLKNKKISLRKKLFYFFVTIDGFWSWACASLLLLFLGWLPLLLGGDEFNISLFSYNLPRLTGKIMTFSSIGMISAALLNILFLPPRPQKVSFFTRFGMVFQWALLPVTLIIFGAFPALEAQARMMVGKYLGFWNTPKVRNYSK